MLVVGPGVVALSTLPATVGVGNSTPLPFTLPELAGAMELEPVPVATPPGATAAPVPVVALRTGEFTTGLGTDGEPTPCT
jgi:hypothetical protein